MHRLKLVFFVEQVAYAVADSGDAIKLWERFFLNELDNGSLNISPLPVVHKLSRRIFMCIQTHFDPQLFT